MILGIVCLISSDLWSGDSDVVGETDHFYYRLAPAGPYVDSQRGNRAFGFSEAKVFLSEDSCQSWAHSHYFPDAENITFSCLTKNGNVLFATRERLFLSADKLASIVEVIVKNADGSDYLPHTPKNPDQPGWYFHALDGMHDWGRTTGARHRRSLKSFNFNMEPKAPLPACPAGADDL